jgi:hypothetical protein
MRATGAKDLKELAQRCNELLPDSYPKRVQDWEKYDRGKHAPSIDRGGAPGIVRILGSHFPATLRVAEHVIWDALNPGIEVGTLAADRLLAKLHPIATDPFVSSRSETTIVRDWEVLNAPRRHFPKVRTLTMDYIACYLILFRNTKENSPPPFWVSMLDTLAATVSIAPSSVELGCLGLELERYIDRAFLSPSIGPRWQAPNWPFYRGLATQPQSSKFSRGTVHLTDVTGNLKQTEANMSLRRCLAVLLDGYPPGPIDPAHLDLPTDR